MRSIDRIFYLKKFFKMEQEKLKEIWERVMAGDKDAKSILIGLYLSKFPENIWFTEKATERTLHVMYKQLLK